MYCCFTGHRPQNLGLIKNENSAEFIKLKAVLDDIIEQSICDGYIDFYCGMALGIDMIAATILLEKAQYYPNIKLHAAIPCPQQSDSWNEKDKIRYEEILSNCHTKTIMSPFYTNSCMLSRNKFMVDNSQRVIAVWNGSFRGGTAYTVRYAKQKQREIFVIRPKDLSVTLL